MKCKHDAGTPPCSASQYKCIKCGEMVSDNYFFENGNYPDNKLSKSIRKILLWKQISNTSKD